MLFQIQLLYYNIYLINLIEFQRKFRRLECFATDTTYFWCRFGWLIDLNFKQEALGRPPSKRRLQQFFFAAWTSLPSRYLAALGGYTDRPTDSPLVRHEPRRKLRVQHFFYCRCIAKKGGMHFTELLPSNDRRDTYTDTQTDERYL
jgi:hypothetical protein